jgi:hypothetical protein
LIFDEHIDKKALEAQPKTSDNDILLAEIQEEEKIIQHSQQLE